MVFNNGVCLGGVQAETSEPERTQAPHPEDSHAAEPEEVQANQSPHSASPTPKVVLKDGEMMEQVRKEEFSAFWCLISRLMKMEPVVWSHLQLQKVKQVPLSPR